MSWYQLFVTCAPFIAIVLAIIAACIVVGVEGSNAKFKTYEVVAILAATFAGGLLVWSTTHKPDAPPPPARIPNVTGVVWEDDTVTFPAPTERGCRWGIITPKTPKSATTNGEVVGEGERKLAVDEKDGPISVFMEYPDGNNSTAVQITKKP